MARQIQRSLIIQRPASTGAQAAREISGLISGIVGVATDAKTQEERRRAQQEAEQEQIERQGFGEEIRQMAESLRDPQTGAINPDAFSTQIERRAASKRTELNAAIFRSDASAILARDQYRQTELDEMADVFEGQSLGMQLSAAVGTDLQSQFDGLRDDQDPNTIDELKIRDQYYGEALSQGRVKTRAGQRALYESLTRSTIREKSIRSEAHRQAKIDRTLRQGINVFADQVASGSGTADLHSAIIQRRNALQAIGAPEEAIVENERAYVRITIDQARSDGNLALIDRARELNGRLGTRGIDASTFGILATQARRDVLALQATEKQKAVNAIVGEATARSDFDRAANIWNTAKPLFDLNDDEQRATFDSVGKSIENARTRWLHGQREGIADNITAAIEDGQGSIMASTAFQLRGQVERAIEDGLFTTRDEAAPYLAKISAAAQRYERYEAQATSFSEALDHVASGQAPGRDLSTLPDDFIVSEFDRRLAGRAVPTGEEGIEIVPPATFAQTFALFQSALGDRMPSEILQRIDIGPGATEDDFARFASTADALQDSGGGAAFLQAHLTTDESLASLWLFESGVRDAGELKALVGDAPAGALQSAMSALLGDGEDQEGALAAESDLAGATRNVYAGRFLRDYLRNWTSGAPIETVEAAAKSQAKRTIDQGSASLQVAGRRYTFPRFMMIGQEKVDLTPIADSPFIARAIDVQILEAGDTMAHLLPGTFDLVQRNAWFRPQFDRLRIDDSGQVMLPIDYVRPDGWFREARIEKNVFEIVVPRSIADVARAREDYSRRWWTALGSPRDADSDLVIDAP